MQGGFQNKGFDCRGGQPGGGMVFPVRVVVNEGAGGIIGRIEVRSRHSRFSLNETTLNLEFKSTLFKKKKTDSCKKS